jgi:hypothetical protein
LAVSEALARAVAVVQMVRLVRDVFLRLVIEAAMRERSSARRMRRVNRRRWVAAGTYVVRSAAAATIEVDSWKKRSAFAGLGMLLGWVVVVLTRLLAMRVMTWSRRRAAAASITKDSASAIRDTMHSIMVGTNGMAISTAGATGVRATMMERYITAVRRVQVLGPRWCWVGRM